MRVADDRHIEPASGGHIALRLRYSRGQPIRLTSDAPSFPVFAARAPEIMRSYQEDSLIGRLYVRAAGIDRLDEWHLAVTVPELAAVLDGSERLLVVMTNEIYARRTFSAGQEYEQMS